jgi:hypothetical protein
MSCVNSCPNVAGWGAPFEKAQRWGQAAGQRLETGPARKLMRTAKQTLHIAHF